MKKIIILILAVLFLLSCKDTKNIQRKKSRFGIDISHYQGEIDWDKVGLIDYSPIYFIIMRASVGTDCDKQYHINYMNAKRMGFKIGSYHYYRPNENSTLQAKSFLKVLKYSNNDLAPVVDVEVLSTIQSIESLKCGIANFLTIIEKETGLRPMIYTSDNFFQMHLKGDKRFFKYGLWIANYSNRPDTKCKIWQYSCKKKATGINGPVDANILLY